ncbi:MAG: nickel-dependent hydrogenase large subunit [Ancalomicrobiaceae bacterium]|nr:nickel-dependent hydrogenase large subunit [Ancalomicrobiaceae bacterium]
MTRHIVGPFNRVEGDLELGLDIEAGVVTAARVTAPTYRGFEQILVGRPALDALAIAPRICGICSVSQSIAAATALRAIAGIVPPPNGVLAANIAHAAENIADHLTHFAVFFMPDFTRRAYAGRAWYEAAVAAFAAHTGRASADILPARARLLHILGAVAGKWPHSLAFQPGGTTRALDLGARMRLSGIVEEFARCFEASVLGVAVDVLLELATPEALAAYAEETAGLLPLFLRMAADTGCDALGPGPGPLMSFGAYPSGDGPLFPAGVYEEGVGASPLDASTITEDPSHAWMAGKPTHPAAGDTRPDADKTSGYSFAKAPRLAGRPVEVGAIARQAIAGQPLIRTLLARDGGSRVTSRIVGRMLEVARLIGAMRGWIGALDANGPYCADGPARFPDGAGSGLIEAARGSLGHWVEVKSGRIARYQIVAPTTWNFSPRDEGGVPGPLEQALAGLDVGEAGAEAVAVQHIVRSFDPCMVCTAH